MRGWLHGARAWLAFQAGDEELVVREANVALEAVDSTPTSQLFERVAEELVVTVLVRTG